MKKKEEKGITLIALVITIILLLILAGVTIRWLTTGNSIFKYAELAEKETKKGDIIEYLNLALVEEKTEGYNKEAGTVVENTQKRVKERGEEELKGVAKEIEVKEVERREKEEKEEYYFYVVVDEEVYKVEEDGTKYLGKRADKEVELQTGEIEFKYSETELTNQNVKVTIKTETNIEGAKIYYKTEGEKGKEENEEWREYKGEVEIVKNCSIVARLEGILGEKTKEATGNIQNIDKLEPKKFTPESSATTNSIKVTAQTEDQEKTEEYAESGVIGYSFSIGEGEWSEYKEKGEYTFNSLTQGTEYTIKIKAKDKVGNEMKEPVEIKVKTGNVVAATTGEGGNISFKYSETGWTKNDVTVTASTTSGFIIETSIDKKTWEKKTSQTLKVNGNVYARLVDTSGQFADGESWATAEVSKIDKSNPNVPKITMKLTDTAKTNYASGTWTNQNVEVTFEATDNGGSGVSSYEYSTDKTNDIVSKTSPFTINTDGITNIYIRAVDVAGNKGNWSALNTVKRDTVAPTVTLTGKANGTTNVTLTGGGTDATSNISYMWSTNGTAPVTGWSSDNNKSISNKSTNVTANYYFWVKDEAGNTASKQAVISKHTHSNGCYNTCGGSFVFTGEIEDGWKYIFKCNRCGASNWDINDSLSVKCEARTTLKCGQNENYVVSIK